MKKEKAFLLEIGNRIASIRKSKGFSHTKLGYLCDIEKSNLIRIEKGRTNPTSLTLFKISLALEVSVKDFFE